MHHSDFVPLHLHSQYSLLDGAIKIDELVEAAAGFNMPAVAITDHGNMFGAVDFYFKAQKAGVKPILGCEVYLAQGSRLERDPDKPFHLVLLAADNTGYKNLIKMVSSSFLEGFYKRPRIDRELLTTHSEGLIGLSACLQGEVPYHLRQGDHEGARSAALWYREVLGEDNFYFELQKNGLPEQDVVNKGLITLSKELGIDLLATNDCHYLRESDKEAHETLLCIQTGTTMNDPDRFRFRGSGYYFRSPEQMKEDFADVPEAVTNTRAVAERCNVTFDTDAVLLPQIKVEGDKRPRDILKEMAWRGLEQRLGAKPDQEYSKRLERELEVIMDMGYSSYFLIVEDFISYAKQNHIPVGPGRGSAAGSLVAYSLGITELDPIRYGLLFERFLNPERVSMPDIDVDFCKDKRGEVIRHVQEKYGRDHVAQIITFGTMAARAVIRDVSRALDYPYAEADKLAKLVPETLGIKLKDAITKEPELKRLYKEDEQVARILDIGMRLEGLTRHASTHAAGVVIAPEPMTNYAPLYKAPNDEVITTQFDMGSVERIGLIKFDFLGLKTLTVIEKCTEYLKSEGVELDIAKIPLDDKETYRFLGTGKTTGVFQLESDGMKDILIKMQPNHFEDIIALVALYRPGPIGSGMIDDFIRRKRDGKEIKYDFPMLKDTLDETYGVILYQEQVMSIANKLSGFSLGQADVLRKAMGKKIAAVMAEQRERFVGGAVANGHNERKAANLFDLISKFAEYGFNKSHSAAYALIAYQTAYLKAHHPAQFMAATLTLDIDTSDKVVKNIKECRDMDIRVLAPDINLCGRDFTVDGGHIRFGLGAVKGAGAAAVDSILAARGDTPFDSMEDYLARVDLRKVNKKVNEGLIKSGAFDSLTETDGSLASLGKIRSRAMEKLSASGGQIPSLSLFGDEEDQPGGVNNGWSESDLLKNEKDALGFYISGNPLSKYAPLLEATGIMSVSGLKNARDKETVEAAGVVMSIRKLQTKKGELMAALVLEDEEAMAEVIVFPDLYRTHAGIIETDRAMLVRGQLEKSEKGLKIVGEEMSPLEDLPYRSGGNRRAVITVSGGESNPKAMHSLKDVVDSHRGELPLYLKIRSKGSDTLLQTAHSITPDLGFINKVEQYFGKGALKVV